MRVKCISRGNHDFITVGKHYESTLYDDGKHYIRNDTGLNHYYDASLFETDKFHVVCNNSTLWYDKDSVYEVSAETTNEYFLVNKLGQREWISKKNFSLYETDKINIFTEKKETKVIEEKRKYIVICEDDNIGGEENTKKLTIEEARAEVNRLAQQDMTDGYRYYIISIEEYYDTEEVITYKAVKQ